MQPDASGSTQNGRRRRLRWSRADLPGPVKRCLPCPTPHPPGLRSPAQETADCANIASIPLTLPAEALLAPPGGYAVRPWFRLRCSWGRWLWSCRTAGRPAHQVVSPRRWRRSPRSRPRLRLTAPTAAWPRRAVPGHVHQADEREHGQGEPDHRPDIGHTYEWDATGQILALRPSPHWIRTPTTPSTSDSEPPIRKVGSDEADPCGIRLRRANLGKITARRWSAPRPRRPRLS